MFICGPCSFPSFHGNKHLLHLLLPPACPFLLHVLALPVCVRYTSWDVGFCMKTFGGGSSRTAHTCSCAAQCPVVVYATASPWGYFSPHVLFSIKWRWGSKSRLHKMLLFWGLYTSLRVRWRISTQDEASYNNQDYNKSFTVAVVNFSNYD